MSAGALALLGAPHAVDATTGISEHHGHPLIEGHLCLWVGREASERVATSEWNGNGAIPPTGYAPTPRYRSLVRRP